MKFASVSPAAAREDRRDRLRRDRAAAFALRTVFPELQQIRLELRFESATNTPALQSHILHPPARAFFEFPCPYADCDGRFDLAAAVKAAVASSTHQAQGTLVCAGERSGDRGSRQPCQLRLCYTVTATYQKDL